MLSLPRPPSINSKACCLSPWEGCCSQLEVLRNSEDGGERGSLLYLLDHTRTPMGGRLLRHWIAHPLRHAPSIEDRLDAVQELAAAAASGESRVHDALLP